jgi:hypothetical protein
MEDLSDEALAKADGKAQSDTGYQIQDGWWMMEMGKRQRQGQKGSETLWLWEFGTWREVKEKSAKRPHHHIIL